MRLVAALFLAFVLFLVSSCGGGGSSSSQNGPLSGNWQLAFQQEFPHPPITFPVSGFLLQSKNSVTGSFVVPGDCSGAGPVTGTLSGQSVTLTINEGGSTLTLTGQVSSDNKSMAGSYAGVGGGCGATSTTGTWSAILVPPLTGNFTGTISNSTYMELVTGVTPPAPIMVSGTMTQSSNIGASNASLSGTITATTYPCFYTASLTGTITGQNVDLTVYGLGPQIGYIGQNPTSGLGTPAMVTADAGSALSLTATNTGNGDGLELGILTEGVSSGPCPQVLDGTLGIEIENDSADVSLTFQ